MNDRLLLVDMLAGAVVDVAGEGRTRRRKLAAVAAAIRARRGGGYVLAIENRFVLLGPDLTQQRRCRRSSPTQLIRMNDGGCDPQGRFYCGTMAYDETPGAGTLYRLDPDGSVEVTLRDVTISNGLQWNRAGDTVFYSDTPTGRVDRFDFDPASGAFTDRRTFAEISGGGTPDGLAIDVEDGIWVALWGGSAVHRYDSDGRLDLVGRPARLQRDGLHVRRARPAHAVHHHLTAGPRPRRTSPMPAPSSVMTRAFAGAAQHAYAG